MANISTYLKNKLLDKCVGAVNFTPAATLWIRLFSTDLTVAGTGTELSNPSYQALEIGNDTTTFPLAASGAKANAVRFDFDAAEEDWTAIEAVGLFDAETGGNLYFFENLTAPIAVETGENLYFDIGDIEFSFE